VRALVREYASRKPKFRQEKPMDAIELLRYQVRQTWDWLDMTMSDVTEEEANWQPPGIANSIAATYAHTMIAADEDFNKVLAGDLQSSRPSPAHPRRRNCVFEGHARGDGVGDAPTHTGETAGDSPIAEGFSPQRVRLPTGRNDAERQFAA